MDDRIRFHLDENVNPVITQALRRYGIDVTTTADAGILSSPDNIQFDFALRENRVIVTDDDDFLRIASFEYEHPGITFCQLQSRSIGEIVRAIRLIYEALTPEDMRGRVEYL
jgi:predicted nuclease of predicted toxin-antitoxin system